MVKYALQRWIFLYNSYVRKKSYKLCKRRFNHKCPSVLVAISSLIFKLVEKVGSIGSFLEKKCCVN
jgi:hypothetical protein